MGTRILGIDLGAYSVKVAVATPGFRQAALSDFIERPVPPGDEPVEVRAARVLGEILRDKGLTEESAFCAVPGDQVFVHVLEFSFRNLRRQQMEHAVGGELDGILPVDLEDMVYSYEKIPDDLSGRGAAAGLGEPLGDDDPTFVKTSSAPGLDHGRLAAPAEGMRLLACAMPRDRARSLLDRLAGHGIEARGLLASPTSCARPARRVAGLAADAASSGQPFAVIDVGHSRTDVCVINEGRTVFARSIGRGGRDITEAISRTWRLSFEDAEKAKHTDGFIASSMQPAASEAWQRIHEVIVTQAAPLARDLRQTLSACRAKTGATVARALLVGGGSRLRGMSDFLSEGLGVPVGALVPDEGAAILGVKLAGTGAADVAFLAAGVAFEGASGRPTFDLRQGELAYQADLSFLRAKAYALATATLFVIAFAALNAYAALHKIHKSEDVLKERLALETLQAFGDDSMAPEDVLVRTGATGGGIVGDSPLPRMTAYDLLLDINGRLPTAKEVKIDVGDLDIKPGKITMKAITGTTEKHGAIEASTELIKKLESQECFTKVERGDLASGANDTQSFPVTITTSCR